MAEFIYYCGTMNSGKSTLALQMEHNHASRGRRGLVFTKQDRAGVGVLSSRLGLELPAIEVSDDYDFHREVVALLSQGERVDFLVCDEAQFYAPEQIEQLALVVDNLDIDVFAFGILADFRTLLFPGSMRLIELVDHIRPLQVEALCWCGQRATHNARTVGGVMTIEGEQVLPGDTADDAVVSYEVLCRRHHMRRVTARSAHADQIGFEPLPFGD